MHVVQTRSPLGERGASFQLLVFVIIAGAQATAGLRNLTAQEEDGDGVGERAGDWRGGGATALSSRPVRASMRTIIMTRVVLPAEAARAMALPAVITGNSIEQIRIILFYLLPDLRHRAHLIMTHLIIMLSFLHELGGVRAGRRQELQNGM